MVTAEEFYRRTLGHTYDLDGVPKGDPFQCADYFKEACRQVLGYHWATGGDGYVDNWWYSRAQHASEFSYIEDWSQFKNGDFVLWPHSKRDPSTPFFYSHVAMFWQKSDGKKYMVGQNQPDKRVTEKPEPDRVWAKALGAFRFKAWGGTSMDLAYGKSSGTYNGISWTAVRGSKAKGYDLHVLSGDHDHDVKNIDQFDSDKLVILAGVNCNYFRRDDGTHLGCEGDGYVQGYQQIVPLQKGWLAFFQKDGQTACWDSPAYYYDQTEVDFVCTPYACRMLHGTLTYKRSLNCSDKDDIRATQTAAIRFANGDWAIAIFSECFPREVCAWAQQYEGVQDVILMDSGGSTQMFECTSGTRKVVKSTGRKVANALVIAKKIDPKQQVPSTPDTPATPHEETIPELKSHIDLLERKLAAAESDNEKLTQLVDWLEKSLNAAIKSMEKVRAEL